MALFGTIPNDNNATTTVSFSTPFPSDNVFITLTSVEPGTSSCDAKVTFRDKNGFTVRRGAGWKGGLTFAAFAWKAEEAI